MTGGPSAAVWIALGSNLGDRPTILREAVSRLAQAGLPAIRSSHLYETAPEHGRSEPAYLNAVMQCESDSSPPEILQILFQVEEDLGRDLSDRSGSRTCDLDLLAVGDLLLEHPEVTLPHPRLASRVFVLVPLCEIDPCWTLPGSDQTAAELLSALPYHANDVCVHAPLLRTTDSQEKHNGTGSESDRGPSERRVEG